MKYIGKQFRYLPKTPMNDFHCLICDKPITLKVNEDSLLYYGFPLCFPHRRMIDESRVSPLAMKLYFALRSNRIPVLLEFKNEGKTIDIALPGKLFMEVSDSNSKDLDQELADFYRTGSIKSKNEIIPTIQIPNSLILDEFRFNKALNRIIEMCNDFKKAG